MSVINLIDLQGIEEVQTFLSYPETSAKDNKHITNLITRSNWRILDTKIVEIQDEKETKDGQVFIRKTFCFVFILGRKKQ